MAPRVSSSDKRDFSTVRGDDVTSRGNYACSYIIKVQSPCVQNPPPLVLTGLNFLATVQPLVLTWNRINHSNLNVGYHSCVCGPGQTQ